MFSFLAPAFLAGAAIAAVPIVLHLLKRDPEQRVKFAAVRLLKNAPVERSERHRLRELLLLALRVAALALLATAFARPFFPSGRAAGGGDVTMIALDTSYSLAAPGRFERARQLALQALDRVPAGDRVGVVTFSDEAAVAARPTVDRELAKSAIAEAQAGFGSTRYRAALAAASQQLDRGKGRIVVVTDLQEIGWDAGDRVPVPEGATIEVADVGPMPPNLAVVAIRPLSDRVVATIRNTGPGREAHARLTLGGRASVDATVALGPNQSGDVVFAGAPGSGTATVSIEDPEGVQPDNVRYAVIGGTNRTTVGVVTGTGDVAREAFYVQQALAVSTPGSGAAYQVVPLSGAKLTAMAPAELSSHAALFLLSTRGLERRGRELLASYVRAGGGVFIAAGVDVDGDVIADVLGAGTPLRVSTTAAKPSPRALAPADVRHPIFRPFAATAATLGLVTFQNVARIGGDGCQTLARFTTGEIAFVDCAAGEGRALVLASDLDNRWNDFPLHATFVPFLHEAVRYLSSAAMHASEYVVGDARDASRPGIATISPRGPLSPGPADRANPSSPGRSIAVNVDVRESDPARLSAEDFQSAVTRLKDIGATEAKTEAREQEDRQQLWRYALGLMAMLMVVEGLVAARTA
ncbi:MAG TPA: BatA domain-containing protein [Vicinamibacterales bacterium]|nr:BatA domain-containing protein [Vicinamibacterales bacterium]